MNDRNPLMEWRNKPEELSRRHLDGKGQWLGFFRDGIRIEDDDMDRSEIVGRLPCPFVLKVVPYSSYCLTFQSQIDFVDGVAPSVLLREWDLNADDTGNVCVCHIEAGAIGEWQEQRIEMHTGWNGQHLVPEIWTSKGGRAKMTVKEFTVTQTSENEGLRPRPTELLCVENVVFEREKKLGACALADHAQRLELDLEFVAENFKGRCFLAMQWMDNHGTVLAEDRGEFASEQSVGGSDASVTLRWRRHYGQQADGVSLAMTRYIAKDDTQRVVGEQNRLFCGLPRAAARVGLGMIGDDSNQGRLSLSCLRLRTY